MKNWISTNEKQRFALKKIAGKTVSVLIGTTLFGFYLGTKTEVHVVKADTITDVSTKLEQAKPETTPEVDTKSAIKEASDNVARDAVQTTDTTNNKEQSATLATPIKSLAPTVASNKTSEVSDSLKVPTEKTTEPTSNLNTENNQKDAVQTTDTTNNKEQSATLATPIKSLAPTVASNKTSEVSDSLKVPTEKTTEPTSNLNTENNQKDAVQTTDTTNNKEQSATLATPIKSLAPTVVSNKTSEVSDSLKVPTEKTSVPTSNLNTENNQIVKNFLAASLVLASSTRSLATDQEAELPESKQRFELQPTSFYNGLVSTEKAKGKEATWLWKALNSYWHSDEGYTKIKETLNDAKLYYFAVFADYSNSDHNFILVARDKNDLDNPTITAKIVDFYRGVNTETLTVAANSSQTSTESTKGRYTIQNFGNGSYSVTLNTGTNPYGLLPVIDRGLLNPDLAGKSKGEYDAIAKSKSISSYSSYIPKRRTQLIRYVDRATGKDLVQPIKISGYGNQQYQADDITPPTVDGYTYERSSGFASDGLVLGDYGYPTTGNVTEFSVGETFDLSENSDVMVRSTVIEKNGSIRSVVYYKGKPLNETVGTSGVRILGTSDSTNKMYFTVGGKDYMFINPVTATDNSTVYYYAKTGHEQESTMTVHYIDVTNSGINSNFIPSDGTEIDKQVLTGKIDEKYTNTLKAPEGYQIVAKDKAAETGTYSIDAHDAYVYVKKPDTSTEQEVKLPDSKVEVSDPNHLTDGEKQQVKDKVAKSNPDAKDIKVGDNGYTDVSFKNGNHGHVAGSELVTKKPDTSTEQEVKLPDSKVEVSDPNHLTDGEKQQVKDKVAKSNPDAKDIKVGDNGYTDVSFKNGNHGHVAGSELIIKKDNNSSNTSNNTDADKHPAVIPDTKTPVQDPNHLTDAEKSQIKDNVSKSNPNVKDILVGNNADTTLIYGDGSKNVIKGTDLIVVKLTSTISPSKNTSGLQGKDKNTSNKNEVSSKQTLPQTGESDNVLAVISGAVMTILSVVTFGLIKRRKE
ncbi:MucBP domain-containing protein [Lactobacillus sp. UMNPBX6]|uniref:MucBP domain-containing protein n=1 Tax=Lactobacillus sp. UMNPBX6 TaxID=2042041 RepID=UPI000BEEF3B7|nr:MucBP domain-containing protein [Lactobacillus sp. UMNPBX6]PEH02026.1 hypothetical protein CP357_07735 [Lactobacillus sp. UMNPBX6]